MSKSAAAEAKESTHEHYEENFNSKTTINRKINCFFQPNILVIDDNPNPLLTSLEQYMDVHYGYKAHFQVKEEANSPKELNAYISSADIVLLDHRINKKFKSFKSGVEIGLYIREQGFNMPIVYYTGYPDDLTFRANETLKEKWGELEKKNIKFFDKADLQPSKKLNELCNFIFEKTKIIQENLNISGEEIIQTLQDAQIEQIKEYRYELLDFDRRKSKQNLRCLSNLDMDIIDVPTKYLDKIGIRYRNENINLKIVRFDRGQILSFLHPISKNEEAIAPDVLALLEED